MKPLTREWVVKAEEDYRVARREQHAKPPAHTAVCFHAQQCVEKYLKALLQEHELSFSRTHDLEALMMLGLPVCQS
jgi:HEPN domain-containing protein